MAKKPTQIESDYMGAVASLGCLICDQPAEVHHIREGQGASQRASNFLTVPLCREHHRGDFSIHGSYRSFTNIYGSELDMVAQTIEKVFKSLK